MPKKAQINQQRSKVMLVDHVSQEVLFALCDTADVPADAWKNRLTFIDVYKGKGTKNFITLLTGDQLAKAAATSFAGKTDTILLSFKVESMREEADLKIKYEAAESEAGGSGEYVHVFGGIIPYACLYAMPKLLEIDESVGPNRGKHMLPPLGMGGGGLEKETVYDDDSDLSENDDLERFDQHTYDLDD